MNRRYKKLGAARDLDDESSESIDRKQTAQRDLPRETGDVLQRRGPLSRSPLNPSGQCNRKVSFDVVLISTAGGGGQREGTLNLATMSRTVAELKEEIQKNFKVPTYDQKVTFRSLVLKDEDTIASHRLLDGDMLVVEYSSVVDVENVNRIVAQLQTAADFLKTAGRQLVNPSASFLGRVSQTLKVRDLDQCVQQTYSNVSASPEETAANGKYFVHVGGLKLLNEIHAVLLNHRWDKMCHFDLYLYETVILHVILCLSGSIPQSQKCETFQPSIRNIIGSFLRVPVYPNKAIIVPNNKHLSAVSRDEQFRELVHGIFLAVKALAKYV